MVPQYITIPSRGISNQQIVVPLLSSFAIGFITAYCILSQETFLNTTRSRRVHLPQNIDILPVVDTSVHRHDEEFHKLENSTVADMIYNKVKVFCWVMTSPKNHKVKAKHVKATWGKRCHKLLFMSTAKDDSLPAIALPVKEGRKHLWDKTKEAFKYIYHNHLEDADWFLKADDDTYVILENLRLMLLSYDPSKPMYFGRKFKPYVKQGYMSGGAGYVLSKEAVKRFVEMSLLSACTQQKTPPEDLQMGKCMQAANVTAGDSRDSMKRERFFSFKPEDHLLAEYTAPWFWSYNYYDGKRGMDGCSDNSISFHYIPPPRMYSMEFLIYHLRPFGIGINVKMPPELQEKTSPPKTTNNRFTIN